LGGSTTPAGPRARTHTSSTSELVVMGICSSTKKEGPRVVDWSSLNNSNVQFKQEYTGKQVDEITIIADAELVDAGAATAVASAPPSKEDGGKGQPAMAEAVPMATVRPYLNMTTTRCFAIIATTMTVTAPMTSATPPQPGRPSSAIFTIITTAGRRAESRGGDPGNR